MQAMNEALQTVNAELVTRPCLRAAGDQVEIG